MWQSAPYISQLILLSFANVTFPPKSSLVKKHRKCQSSAWMDTDIVRSLLYTLSPSSAACGLYRMCQECTKENQLQVGLSGPCNNNVLLFFFFFFRGEPYHPKDESDCQSHSYSGHCQRLMNQLRSILSYYCCWVMYVATVKREKIQWKERYKMKKNISSVMFELYSRVTRMSQIYSAILFNHSSRISVEWYWSFTTEAWVWYLSVITPAVPSKINS
jgi:hypothetical protein